MAPKAAILLRHLERDLGRFAGHGLVRDESELGFSALRFRDRPEEGVNSTVTFGVSTHVLEGADRRPRRQELLVTLRGELDAAAVDIAANVGAYMLQRHVALLVGESVAMPRHADSDLDALVAAPPEPFSTRLARCEATDPATEIVWLLPCSRPELHIAVDHGLDDLLRHIRERGEDPYDLARTPVL